MKELEKQLMLNLSTGGISEVTVQPGITVKAYFTSLSILNRGAHDYGVLYMATDEALSVLGTLE
jgi:hypothetical protein